MLKLSEGLGPGHGVSITSHLICLCAAGVYYILVKTCNGVLIACEKHENPIAKRKRQTRTFEHPVVKNIESGLFELVVSELDQEVKL